MNAVNDSAVPIALNMDLYVLYKDAGPSWPLIVCALPLSLVGTAGILMNLGVIWVTLKSKNFRGTANYMIALTCLFEVLHQLAYWLFLCVTLSGVNFMDYWLVNVILTPSFLGIKAVFPMMLFIGLDRLFAVLFPIQFSQKSSSFVHLYLTIVTLLCAVYSAYYALANYNTADQVPHLKVTGTVVDQVLVANTHGGNSMATILTIIGTTILLYIAVGLVIKFRKSASRSANDEGLEKRIFKSLLIITALNMGGYFVVGLFTLIIAKLHLSALQMWFASQAMTVVSISTAGVNGPVLYLNSEEYRKAFLREIKFLKSLFVRNGKNGSGSTVVSVGLHQRQPLFTVSQNKNTNQTAK